MHITEVSDTKDGAGGAGEREFPVYFPSLLSTLLPSHLARVHLVSPGMGELREKDVEIPFTHQELYSKPQCPEDRKHNLRKIPALQVEKSSSGTRREEPGSPLALCTVPGGGEAVREEKPPGGGGGWRRQGGACPASCWEHRDCSVQQEWGSGLFHTDWAGSQVPSRDLVETQRVGTSGPDAGAGSPVVAHPSDSRLDNRQWKQKKEAQSWETHQRTARGHSPPCPDVTATFSWSPETTCGEKGPQRVTWGDRD